jgi:hypothetical protein
MKRLVLMTLLVAAPPGAATAPVAVDDDWSCDIANLLPNERRNNP